VLRTSYGASKKKNFCLPRSKPEVLLWGPAGGNFWRVPAAPQARQSVNFVQNRSGFGCINAPIKNQKSKIKDQKHRRKNAKIFLRF